MGTASVALLIIGAIAGVSIFWPTDHTKDTVGAGLGVAAPAFLIAGVIAGLFAIFG